VATQNIMFLKAPEAVISKFSRRPNESLTNSARSTAGVCTTYDELLSQVWRALVSPRTLRIKYSIIRLAQFREWQRSTNGMTFSPSVKRRWSDGGSTLQQIRAGKLRALAVTSAKRSDVLPDIPTVGEFVPGYEASGWFGLGAPKNTPAEIIDTLNREINAGLADPTMQARLADLGGTVLPGSPADFGKLIAQDTEKWGKVIRAANIKPD
jgi:hypothetical protein